MWRRGDDLAVDLDQRRRRAVSNASWRAQQRRRRPWPGGRSGSSRPPTPASAPSALDQHVVDELLRRLRRRTRGRTGSRPARATPSPAIRSALIVERGEQLRRGLGRDDRARVRLEGEHGVGAADHLAVAEVHAVELADRDLARPALDVGEPGDLHQPRKPTTGLSSAVLAGSASAIRPSSSVSRTAPVAPSPAHRHAVGRAARVVARQPHAGQEASASSSGDEPLGVGVGDVERADRRCAAARRSRRRRGRRSASARRCPTSTRSRTPRGRPRASSCSKRCTVDLALGQLDRLAARAPARTPARPPTLTARVGRRALADRAGRAARAARAGVRPGAISPSGSPVVDVQPSRATRLVALGQRHQEALHARRAPDEHEQQPGGERVERARVADLDAPAEPPPHARDDVVRGDRPPACRRGGRRRRRSELLGQARPAGTRPARGQSSVGREAGRAAVAAAALRRARSRETSTRSSVARSETLRAAVASPSPRQVAHERRRPRCPRPSAGGRRRPRSSSRRRRSRRSPSRVRCVTRQQPAVEALDVREPARQQLELARAACPRRGGGRSRGRRRPASISSAAISCARGPVFSYMNLPVSVTRPT